MNRQGGMVLLTTMLMMVILTLLVLSLMQGVLLYIKASHQMMANHQGLHEMEVLANKLLLTKTVCVDGCVINDGSRQYRYVVDDQGLYPCLQIAVGESLHQSHHWLVTLATMQPPNVVLQLRFAQPADIAKCESSSVRQIRSGVVSWRKVNVSLDSNKIRGKIFCQLDKRYSNACN